MTNIQIYSSVKEIAHRLLSDEVNLLLSELLPTGKTYEARRKIFEFIKQFILRVDNSAETFLYGSTPLRVYLPNCDVDIGVCIPMSRHSSFMLRLYNMLNLQSQIQKKPTLTISKSDDQPKTTQS